MQQEVTVHHTSSEHDSGTWCTIHPQDTAHTYGSSFSLITLEHIWTSNLIHITDWNLTVQYKKKKKKKHVHDLEYESFQMWPTWSFPAITNFIILTWIFFSTWTEFHFTKKKIFDLQSQGTAFIFRILHYSTLVLINDLADVFAETSKIFTRTGETSSFSFHSIRLLFIGLTTTYIHTIYIDTG